MVRWTDGMKLNTTNLNRVSDSHTAAYTVYKNGSTYYAESNLPGGTDYSGTNAATQIQDALDALTAGRYWKERVLIKGDMGTLDTALDIPSYTILELDGKIKVGTSINAVEITSKNMVEIIGGIWMGSSGTTNYGIKADDSGYVTIDSVEVRQFGIGVYVTQCHSNFNLMRSYIRTNETANLHIYASNAGLISGCHLKTQSSSSGASVKINGGSGANILHRCGIEDNTGMGVSIDSSHSNVIRDCYIESNGVYGIYETYTGGQEAFSGRNKIVDNYIDDNDNTVGNRRAQVYIYKGIADVIRGNRFYNGNDLAYTQAAIQLTADADDVIVTENEHDAAGGTMAFLVDAGTGNHIYRNPTYVTENKGSDTIASGTTSKQIAHGLNITPSEEDFTIIGKEDPTNSVGTIWISGIDATNFTVNVENDPGGSNWDFGWKVIVL